MASSKTGSKKGTTEDPGPQSIDARINELIEADDWRGDTLSRIRTLIKQAEPDIVEEVKWRKPSNPAGVPVWSRPDAGRVGIICTGEVYKDKVKVTFASGAALADPSGLFNASLEGAARRAIDIHEGDRIDEKAFKALVRAAAALNTAPPAGGRPRPAPALGKMKPGE